MMRLRATLSIPSGVSVGAMNRLDEQALLFEDER